MIFKLDRTSRDYQQQLAELRRIAAELGGEPRRSVICFKTFKEFNDYKEAVCKKPDATPGEFGKSRKRR